MHEVVGSRLGGVTFGVRSVGLYRHKSMAGKGGMTWGLFGKQPVMSLRIPGSQEKGRSVVQC